jgi:transketolase
MKGFFDMSEIFTLNGPGTNLPSHCDMNRTRGIDMTTGSLGQGLSAAVGMAIAGKMDGKDYTVYCIVGDGESQEGQIWEAAMFAAQRKLDNLIVFTDNNKKEIDGYVRDINEVEPLDRKWEAFGWKVLTADGHDFGSILSAIEQARAWKEGPCMIILNTIKGHGVSFTVGVHSMPLTADDVRKALSELDEAARSLAPEGVNH